MSPNTLICQARPIENFWGCLTQKVYEGGRAVTTEHRIHRKLRKFDLKCMESLMRGVKAKVKSIGQSIVFFLYSKSKFCLLINSLQNKTKPKSLPFLSLKYLILNKISVLTFASRVIYFHRIAPENF